MLLRYNIIEPLIGPTGYISNKVDLKIYVIKIIS